MRFSEIIFESGGMVMGNQLPSDGESVLVFQKDRGGRNPQEVYGYLDPWAKTLPFVILDFTGRSGPEGRITFATAGEMENWLETGGFVDCLGRDSMPEH